MLGPQSDLSGWYGGATENPGPCPGPMSPCRWVRTVQLLDTCEEMTWTSKTSQKVLILRFRCSPP